MSTFITTGPPHAHDPDGPFIANPRYLREHLRRDHPGANALGVSDAGLAVLHEAQPHLPWDQRPSKGTSLDPGRG